MRWQWVMAASAVFAEGNTGDFMMSSLVAFHAGLLMRADKYMKQITESSGDIVVGYMVRGLVQLDRDADTMAMDKVEESHLSLGS
jgi:hypothetical protein